MPIHTPCPLCGGAGALLGSDFPDEPCPECDGTGELFDDDEDDPPEPSAA